MNVEAGLRQRVRQLVDRSPGTQADFAAAVGLDQVKLSKSLNGSRQFRPVEVMRIATWCDVSVAWLVYGTDDPVPGTAEDEARVTGTVRDRIMDAAWDVLIRHGYVNARVVDVAERARVSIGTVESHFLTRDELLHLAMHRKFSENFAEQRATLLRISSPRDRLLRLVDLQLPDTASPTDDWGGWLQMWSWGHSHRRFNKLHCDLVARWNAFIEELLREGQARGDFRKLDAGDVTAQLTAMIDGLGLQVLIGVPGATNESMRRQLHLFAEQTVFSPRRPAGELP
ncbi:TetR/AcrR family transcriptional regulator [Prescottella soli]|uniref:TetR family transcriptional regulator C-terminal domain-containing protein n=1 Tax=Prescottella soli TaxID=1543852 RepID=A0ABW9G0W2_9NOCA